MNWSINQRVDVEKKREKRWGGGNEREIDT
jgi:hypothetical protein